MTGFVFAAVLASAVLHASWNFLAKGAAGDFRVLWSSVALWGTASIVPAAYLLARDGFDPRGAAPLAVSVLAHAWYFVMLGSAYRTGGISTAYPVARGVGAAGTAVFGFLVLGEAFSRAGAAGILLAAAGVMLIGKSGFAAGGCRKAYLFAVLTGAGIVGYSAADKVGAAFVRPFLYLGLLNLGIAAATAPLALRGGKAAFLAVLKEHRFRIPLISLGTGLTYFIILQVYRVERAGYIAAVRESSVVFAVLLGRIFLGERIDGWKAAGVAAIAAGLALIRLG